MGRQMAVCAEIVELCNKETAFQGSNREGLLTRATIQKKLQDWIVFFDGKERPVSATGSAGCGPRTQAMMVMEDLMHAILEHKRVA